MPAKSPFTKAQYEVLQTAAKKARKAFKNQEEMALALGISQPSLSALLAGKWKPGVSTAKAIAQVSGMTLRDLIGDYDEPTAEQRMQQAAADNPFPNLDRCLAFYAATKTWSPWTIAAAKAGYFGPEDVAPPDWEHRLDALEQRMMRDKSPPAPRPR